MKAIKSILVILVLSGMLTTSLANNVAKPNEEVKAVATELTNTEMSEIKGGAWWMVPVIILAVITGGISGGSCTKNSPTGPDYP